MITQAYEVKSIPRIQQVIAILWPSFLMAGVATVLFFVMVDPVDLGTAMRIENIEPLGAYTIGFFLFLLLTSLSSALTCYFERPCEKINRKRH